MIKTGAYAFIKKLLLLSSIALFAIAHVAAQAPVISSFSPASGPIGTSVTITGTGFNATAANNIVFFGATRAKVTAASATSLTVNVPAGTTYQPISVLNDGTTLTGYSSQPFVTTFTPAKGAITAATFMPAVAYNTAYSPLDVSVSDLDGDGKPDLIVSSSGGDLANGNSVSVFRNTSVSGVINGNSFAQKVDFAIANTSIVSTVGDIDGDGKPDLIVVNLEDSTVSVFRNTSIIGSISFAAPVVLHSIYGPFLVKIADIDGDGKPDLVVLSYNTYVPHNYNAWFNTISVFRNTGTTGTISFAPGVAVFSGHGNYSEEDMAVGDIDGDGKPDIAVSLFIPGEVAILRNTSTPGSINDVNSFDAPLFLSTRNSQNLVFPYSVSIGDLDGDGKPDLVVVNNDSSPDNLCIFRNTGSIGSISFAPHVDIPISANYPYISAIGDLDGDGKSDIVVTYGEGTDSIGVFRNISVAGALTTSSFAPVVNFYGGNTVDGFANLAIADLDGDGRAEIIVADNAEATTVSVLHNAASSIATLVNLTINQGTLTPVFASGTINYSDTVSNSTTSVTVTPTVTDTTATIQVNGIAVTSGTASGAIPLVIGPNTITVLVTAQDGTTTDTYTITVIRAASPDASLIDLTVSEGTLSPVFASTTMAYADSVSYPVTSITVTPTTTNSFATITINGTAVPSGTPSNAIPLAVGENTITVIVTAQDGVTTETYTIMIYRGEASNVIYVPNAFTPNGDGRNDQAHVHGENIQSLKFYIYDQWGELLFTSLNQQNGWDGTYKGTKEPAGVYVYYLEAIMNDGQNIKKKGTITLLK